MIVLWIGALVLAVLAGAFVLWPLLFGTKSAGQERQATNVAIYKQQKAELAAQLANGDIDEKAHAELMDELNQTLLDDASEESAQVAGQAAQGRVQWVLLLSAVLVPLLAGGWYWAKGASDAVVLREVMQNIHGQEDAHQAIALLKQQTDKDPDNTENWFMLARMYMQAGKFADATMAYLEVVNREPNDGFVVAEMAQALFLASNNQVTPEVRKITQRALELDPDNGTALGLSGIDAFEQQHYQQAIDLWTRAARQSPEGSAARQALEGGIARARAKLGDQAETPALAQKDESSADSPDAVKPVIHVQVALSDAVPRQGQTVFIYARAWQGARMPLAIQRLTIDDLPATLTLDDTMTMMPGVSLVTAGQLEVMARVSASGSPMPQSGDWQASFGPVSLADGDVSVQLTINKQVP